MKWYERIGDKTTNPANAIQKTVPCTLNHKSPWTLLSMPFLTSGLCNTFPYIAILNCSHVMILYYTIYIYMDGYQLICIHLRHDDNGMACQVMSLDIMSCWKFSLTPSILEIAKCWLLHSVPRIKISHLRKQSCQNSKYWSNGKLFGVVLIIVFILMTTMDLDI